MPASSAAAVTAAGWSNRLLRLGIALPLCIVHDIGWLLAAPREKLRFQDPPAAPALKPLHSTYRSLLETLSESQVLQAIARLGLSDELIAILLARLLGNLAAAFLLSLKEPPAVDLPAVDLPLELVAAHRPSPSATAAAGVERCLHCLSRPEKAQQLLTAVELLDVNMLRLLQAGGGAPRHLPSRAMFSGELPTLSEPSLENLVDLLEVFDVPEVRDVVRFSLDLLPSVLETRRGAGSQQYPIGGYAAIERRGPLDAVLLSELCNDEELFMARLSENELLYHGRERGLEEGRGEHQILIDASASMHGLRQVFARGLAIALAQKLLLLGAIVRLRFFDGRLYEAVPLQGSLSAALPYILSFRSSRGRHYGRVFSDLLHELQSQRAAGAAGGRGIPSSDTGAPAAAAGLTLHILTHGECHIPSATVAALSKLAWLNGIFVLPSGDLALDYLPLLRGCSVITDEALKQPEARRAQALDIVLQVDRTAFFPPRL